MTPLPNKSNLWHVCYIVNLRLPTKNAHGLQIMKMCESFAVAGAEVTLLVPCRFNRNKAEPFSFYGVRHSFAVKKMPVIDLYFLRFLPEKISAAVLLLTFFAAAKIYLRLHTFDLVYTREIFWGLLAKDFVFEVHNFPSKIGRLYRFIFGRIKYFVAISGHLKDKFMEYGVPANKIIVSSDAVDADFMRGVPDQETCRKQLHLPANKKIVLYTGNFFKWKGVDTLAKAAALLPEELYFAFLGATKDSDIKRIDEIIGLRKNTRVFGHIPNQIIPQYLIAADILILPNSARQDISSLYTSPLKLFEYLAAGRPIVASDLPSLREILNETNCVFFKPDDPADLARAIKEILANPTRALSLAQQAQIDAKKYTWSHRADKILKFASTPGRNV